jgi:hypothetical protein
MNLLKSTSGELIIDTLIEVARCSKQQQIILAGSKAPEHMVELHRRGYGRVATTATSGLPRGQYDTALVDGHLLSIKALESTLDWLVYFLAPKGVLAICVQCKGMEARKLGTILEKLGFRVEVGTRCEDALAISARRLEPKQRGIGRKHEHASTRTPRFPTVGLRA